jgi:Tfp pilus assembly protein PilX
MMRHSLHAAAGRTHQQGAVLFVALILMLILSMIAVAAARMQSVEERMARNEDNRQVGAAVAEATLRDVEGGLESGMYPQGNFGFSPGLYDLTTELSNYNGSILNSGTFAWTNASQVLTYNGPAFSALPTTVPAPKYVIEMLPAVVSKGNQLNGSKSRPVFRVTVYAVGADQTSTTIVQSIVHY